MDRGIEGIMIGIMIGMVLAILFHVIFVYPPSFTTIIESIDGEGKCECIYSNGLIQKGFTQEECEKYPIYYTGKRIGKGEIEHHLEEIRCKYLT